MRTIDSIIRQKMVAIKLEDLPGYCEPRAVDVARIKRMDPRIKNPWFQVCFGGLMVFSFDVVYCPECFYPVALVSTLGSNHEGCDSCGHSFLVSADAMSGQAFSVHGDIKPEDA